MRLLVIRHGIAADREEFEGTGQDDGLRPLTREGRWKMEKIAKGLRAIAPSLDVLGSSGYLRADQTAKIIAKEYTGLRVEHVQGLEPTKKPATLLAWLRKQDVDDIIAVVGHEPHLSETVSYLLTRKAHPMLTLSKGGACMVEFSSVPSAGAAELVWLMEPGHLRRLAR